ncbi:MAG: sulfatase-like hydrolase/transferase, partial [Planctomycetes bacterium]|nr:sulfatase-like hydrolase/transferase [Planctomycetota bacterium]
MLGLPAQQPGQTPPRNLLVIVPDDLGVDAVGCYGWASAPPTPVLDALAAGGVRFDHAYVHASCTPSRAAILTGRHAFRSQATMALPPGAPGMVASAVTLAAPLNDAGYQTAMIGKWHLGHRFGLQTPNVYGFQHFEGVLDSGVTNPSAWNKVTNGTVTACSTYIMTDEVDAALQWIQSRTAPWALVLTPTLPHEPFHAPPAHLHTQNLAGLDPAVTPRPFFRAMVEAMDREIGRLLATLGPSVLANTNVVVIADNGTPGAVVQAPLEPHRAKGSLYDGGARVPLLVAGPSVTAPGTVATELVSSVDLFPTLLAMCGIGYPSANLASVAQPLDGVSFLPALAGQSGYGRDFVYTEITGTALGAGYTVRTATHRLVRYMLIQPQHQEFYDLQADPLQLQDLLAAPLSPANAVHFADLLQKMDSVRDDGWAELFGTGCGAGGNVPFFRTQTQPRLGTPFHTAVEAAPAGATAALTVLGTSRSSSGGVPLPLDLGLFGMQGCQLAVSTDLTLLHGVDGVSPPLWLPNQPSLYQTEFYAQGVVGLPGANALGLLWTRSLRCVIGR